VYNFLFFRVQRSYNTTILLDQDNELVPNGLIFLDIHDCGSVERTGTIPVGTKYVILPIYGTSWYDIDDDFNSTMVDECPGRGTALFAEAAQEESAFIKNLSSYTKEPFATVNGEPLETFYASSDKEFYYKPCPIDPDKEFCDDMCDINFQPPDGCDAFAGTDVYPSYAWMAVDEKEWKAGETRTYNYGATINFGEDGEYCLYSLMTSDVPPGTTSDVPHGTLQGIFTLISLLLSLWIML